MGDSKSDGWRYTSNPETIWALPEELRLTAVTDMFRRLATDFGEAHSRGDARTAQEAAAGAIMVMAGLFPDRDDPAHHLVHSIVGAIVSARSGSYDHILLQRGARISGTRAGYGAAQIAAFAVAASTTLHTRGMSQLASRKAAAKILSDLGYSLRRSDHGEPIAVTASAVRRWEEEADVNPIPAVVAPKMIETIERDIVKNNLSTIQEVMGLLAEHAAVFLPRALAY